MQPDLSLALSDPSFMTSRHTEFFPFPHEDGWSPEVSAVDVPEEVGAEVFVEGDNGVLGAAVTGLFPRQVPECPETPRAERTKARVCPSEFRLVLRWSRRLTLGTFSVGYPTARSVAITWVTTGGGDRAPLDSYGPGIVGETTVP